MTTRDPNTTATTDDAASSSVYADDHEPGDGTSSQDGSIGAGMSSEGVDDTDGGAEGGSADDENDDEGGKSGLSPKLQRKLKERAEAMRKLSEAEARISTLETQSKALETLLTHPNGEELLRNFRAGTASKQSPQESVDEFVPKDDFGFDPETKKGLDAYIKSAFGSLVASLKREMQPVVQEVGNVKAQRVNAEWSELAKTHGEGIGKWKAAAEQASREYGIPLKKALAMVSEGEAMTMRAQRAAANRQAEERLPTMPDSRAKGSAVGSKRVLATSFADYLEKTKNIKR